MACRMKLSGVLSAPLGSCKQVSHFSPVCSSPCQLFIHLPQGFAYLLFSLPPLWNEETFERLQLCFVTICSGMMVRLSAHLPVRVVFEKVTARISLPRFLIRGALREFSPFTC
jgi:hypothetical protein